MVVDDRRSRRLKFVQERPEAFPEIFSFLSSWIMVYCKCGEK